MEIKVRLNNIRIAPRKSRDVIDLIRGKSIDQARALLEFTIKKGALPVLKLLNSAVATSVNDLKLNEADLYIYAVTVDEGPKLKRWHPMSRGRAYPLIKRTSRITLVLKDRNQNKKEAESKKTKIPNNKSQITNKSQKLKPKK
mgnify:CR=1 FL=1